MAKKINFKYTNDIPTKKIKKKITFFLFLMEKHQFDSFQNLVYDYQRKCEKPLLFRHISQNRKILKFPQKNKKSHIFTIRETRLHAKY